MNITPLSFGRIVKVNAPINIAQKVADIANWNKKHPLSRNVGNIFCDSGENDVVAFSPTKNKNVSYLFSGADAKKAMDIKGEMIDECDKMCSYYHGEDDLVDAAFASASERAGEKLNKLIEGTKHISSMNVIPTNDGSDIKFIDLNA